MDRHRQATLFDAPGPAAGISRRSLLKGATATGLGIAAGALTWPVGHSAHAAARQSGQLDWQQFDAAVQAAMQTFGMVGAAVAVVNGQGTVHSQTFGVRDLASGAAVTPGTLFRVGSTTKSMTALLLATFIDEGLLGWDQPVIDAWPDFRAPTAALTQTLRVRDLLGMDSGLGEPAATLLHFGSPGALELLQSVATLSVLGPPHTQFFYNNTLSATAGYLPSLAQGVAADALESSYAQLMQARVYGPAGMGTARLGDDPRPYTHDYATGYAVDLIEGPAAEPWVPIGSFAPAGATLASLMDMANYVRLQLRRGVAASGTRVVSAGNLEECWQPHIALPTSPAVVPDLLDLGYAMGWLTQTFTGGRRFTWHDGDIDGFATYMGFFPEDDLGLVILTNMLVTPGAVFFYNYVLNLLLEGRFALNRGLNQTVVGLYQDSAHKLSDLAAQAGAVDAAAIAPYLGYYERDYQLALDAAGVLRLHVSSRTVRVLALPDGSYIGASGRLAGTPIRFARDRTGVATMALEGFETVRWLSGPA